MSKWIYREPNGNWGVKGVPWAEIPDGLYGALYKLHDYEEVWQCENCSYIAQFEANGPISNGWTVCPCCASMIADDTEAVLDEEDEPC